MTIAKWSSGDTSCRCSNAHVEPGHRPRGTPIAHTRHPHLYSHIASKFKVEGVSEALAAEVAPLGLKVTVVEPSGFRTYWAGRSIIESKTVFDDYAQTAGARRKATRDAWGKQRGDPARAAKAMQQVVAVPSPPLRLLLGADTYQLAITRTETQRKAFEDTQELTLSADFPARHD